MTALDTPAIREHRRPLHAVASWTLTRRQLCDLELLACGALAPLTGYLGRDDYESVCTSMRLTDGRLCPMPVTLDVDDTTVAALRDSSSLLLRDLEGSIVARLDVTEAWQPDRRLEAEHVYGTSDAMHAGVEYLLRRTQPWYVSGELDIVEGFSHLDFRDLRHTPADLRAEFEQRGWDRVVAFQTRNPMHRAHQELTLRAAERARAKILLHPIVGMGKPGDLDVRTRVQCYRALLPTYPPGTALLSLLPLAMRMAGPREAAWHAQIRRNYGATHFIVGRDHAGPGTDSRGRPFYAPDASRRLATALASEIGIEIVQFGRLVYRVDTRTYCLEDEVPPGVPTRALSGTELRQRLEVGRSLPPWFTPPEVAAVLRRARPPRHRRGFTVFLTGLSGAGKSTIARALCAELEEHDRRQVTLLDGDVVRRNLSSGLGFSRADRDRNIERIGYVAAQVTRHGGIAVCCPIAPFDAARREARRVVEQHGGFLLVHVSTPLATCEARDRKGLYAQARAGSLTGFTGVDDVYETPCDADLTIDTRTQTPQQAVASILALLRTEGYLRAGQSWARSTSTTASSDE